MTDYNGRLTDSRLAAERLMVFCDGMEAAGDVMTARKARRVARDTIWLVDQLQTEYSARVAMQRQRDQLRDSLRRGINPGAGLGWKDGPKA